MSYLLLELGVAASMAVALVAAIRLSVPLWGLVLLGVAPVPLILFDHPNFSTYSFHGFFHMSLVYEIMDGMIPPSDPLLGGNAVLYPWGHHALIALVAGILDAPPPFIYGLINTAALGFCLILLYRTARVIDFERSAAIIAAALAIFGITVFNRGVVADLYHSIAALEWLPILENRGTPLVAKFFNINSNPMGYLAFCLFLNTLIVSATAKVAAWRCWPPILLAGLIAGLLHPFYLVAIDAVGAAVAIVFVLYRGWNEARRLVIPMLVALGLASAICLPYLLQITVGKNELAGMQLDSGYVRLAGRDLFRYAVTMLPALLLLACDRRGVAAYWSERKPAGVLLLAITLVSAGLYVGLNTPFGSNYKFLICSMLSAGLLVAPTIARLVERRPVAATGLMSLFFLPFSALMFEISAIESRAYPDEFEFRGQQIVSRDSADRQLHEWILDETPRDALFIDTERTLPVFARRNLYIGPDDRGRTVDGWYKTTYDWIALNQGYSLTTIRQRFASAAAVLGTANEKMSAEGIAQLRRDAAQTPIYVVARASAARVRLRGVPWLSLQFENAQISVFRVL